MTGPATVTRRVQHVAPLVALALLAAGCATFEAAPKPSPSPVAAAEPSPTPAPSPTTPAPATPDLPDLPATSELRLELAETITGDISPKSVVASPTGRLFFAQNMMYRHTVTVYNAAFELVATIDDAVTLADFGVAGHADDVEHQGAPVEVDFTSDGRFAYVSNYQMYGPGYSNPGHDGCAKGNWDDSFVYRVDTERLAVDQVISVGAVPKYVAVTPDDRNVLVTNWCTYDLSVIDVASGSEVERIDIGRFPRGIAVSSDSRTAWIAVMGSLDIAVVDLDSLEVSWLKGVGTSPRHLVLSPDDRWLYATLNGEGRVVKIDTETGEVVASVTTGAAPRSMDISTDGASLYIVNYNDDTMSKVTTADMQEVQEVPTNEHPIGITYDPATGNVWVANYSGSIMVFAEGPG